MLRRLIPQAFDFFPCFSQAADYASKAARLLLRMTGEYRDADPIAREIKAIEFVTIDVILAGLVGAILWDLITWYVALPSSSSHALLGGFAGAAMMYAGRTGGVLHTDKVMTTVWFIVIAPVFGLLLGLIFAGVVMWSFRKTAAAKVDRLFRVVQLGSAAAYSLGHGSNDAQKTMGIIAALLYATIWSSNRAEFDAGHVDFPFWIVLVCHAAIALGTMAGGWRQNVERLRPRTRIPR